MRATANGTPAARAAIRPGVICMRVSSRPQVTQDGEHAAVASVVPCRQAKLGENVVDVLLYGAAADHELFGDGGVGAAFGHQREYLTLARGEVADRVPAAGEQLGDNLGVERAAAPGDPAQRVEELGDIRDPVLEQVADAVRTT